MTRRDYSADTRAAVMAALLVGQSVSEVASEYNIPPATIRSWKSRQGNGNAVATVATQKKEEVGDLLLGYLQASLLALRLQAEHFGDKSWLTAQDASSLAVLHGVQVDKAIRLLEALTNADEPEA